jgi:hypothetical protein
MSRNNASILYLFFTRTQNDLRIGQDLPFFGNSQYPHPHFRQVTGGSEGCQKGTV